MSAVEGAPIRELRNVSEDRKDAGLLLGCGQEGCRWEPFVSTLGGHSHRNDPVILSFPFFHCLRHYIFTTPHPLTANSFRTFPAQGPFIFSKDHVSFPGTSLCVLNDRLSRAPVTAVGAGGLCPHPGEVWVA